jgi:hypothetical protein
MKVRASRDDAMVRLVVKGKPVFVISSAPVEIDIEDSDVREQVELMLKLGWLVLVEEEPVQPESVQGSVQTQVVQRRSSTRRSS